MICVYHPRTSAIQKYMLSKHVLNNTLKDLPKNRYNLLGTQPALNALFMSPNCCGYHVPRILTEMRKRISPRLQRFSNPGTFLWSLKEQPGLWLMELNQENFWGIMFFIRYNYFIFYLFYRHQFHSLVFMVPERPLPRMYIWIQQWSNMNWVITYHQRALHLSDVILKNGVIYRLLPREISS